MRYNKSLFLIISFAWNAAISHTKYQIRIFICKFERNLPRSLFVKGTEL